MLFGPWPKESTAFYTPVAVTCRNLSWCFVIIRQPSFGRDMKGGPRSCLQAHGRKILCDAFTRRADHAEGHGTCDGRFPAKTCAKPGGQTHGETTILSTPMAYGKVFALPRAWTTNRPFLLR